MMEFSSTWVFSPPHRVFFLNLRWNPSIEVVILGTADLAFASSRPSNYCRAWLAAKTKMKIFSPNKKRGSGCIEALQVFPIIYRFFCHPRWGRNFSINSMSDQFLFLLLFALKAMKVAKTLPEVRGFWKVTWPLNLDFHLRLLCPAGFLLESLTKPLDRGLRLRQETEALPELEEEKPEAEVRHCRSGVYL